MITGIVIGWLIIGLIVYIAGVVHDILKRQDIMVNWINEAITSKDLPRKKWPLMEPQKYQFLALVKGMVISIVLWPVVANRKLSGW